MYLYKINYIFKLNIFVNRNNKIKEKGLCILPKKFSQFKYINLLNLNLK